jgi:hypothetical protein
MIREVKKRGGTRGEGSSSDEECSHIDNTMVSEVIGAAITYTGRSILPWKRNGWTLPGDALDESGM